MAERLVAAQADLVFRAETGQARADVQGLRRDFHTATVGMSDDTLKLTVAQEKLDKALIRHGPASTQAKQAELAYRREVEQTTASVRTQEAQLTRAQRSTRGVASGLASLRSSAFLATGSLIGGAGLVYGVKSAVEAASDLNEQVSKSRQVFGVSSAAVERWSTTTAGAIGIARAQALEATGTFGNLFNTVGLTGQAAATMSQALVNLAADLASFNNADPAAVLDAIRSGLIGEAEPLRRYGVLLSEARVQQRALADTGKANARSLTDQEKALARYEIILHDTSKAQGDFSRTSEGLANQQRILNARWKDAKAQLGDNLLPVFVKVTEAANKFFDDINHPPAPLTNLWSQKVQKDISDAFGPEVLFKLLSKFKPQIDKALKDFSDSLQPIELTIKSPAVVPSFGQPGFKAGSGAPPVPTGKYTGLTTDQEIALARAENTPGTSDEEKLLRAYIARVRRAQKDGTLTKQELLGLIQLEGQLNRDLQAIIDQRNSANAAAAEKRQAAIEKAAAEEKRRREKLVDAIRRAEISSGPYATIGSGFDSAGVSPAEAARRAAAAAKDAAPTKADIAAAVANAMAGIVNIEQKYAGNFQLGTGALETHGYNQTTELRRLNLAISGLANRGRNPASDYAVSSSWVAGA